MRVLFISKDYTLRNDGGCAVTRRNLSLLKEVADCVEEFIIPVPSMLTRLNNVLLRESYGNTRKLNKRLTKLLSSSYNLVFFDGSIYGGYLKRFADNGYKTMCFFHNVESKYYRDKYNMTRSILDKAMIGYIEHCEALSCEYADYKIVLNERDKTGLFYRYGCDTDLILPTSFDPLDTKCLFAQLNVIHEGEYLLFVGSNFFANMEAVKFIIDEIAPYVQYKIIIIGSICQAFDGMVVPPNVVLKGFVSDLLPYYVNARCVINPVFSGSGLKTKTIEALRYGKYVLGTTECFEGIPRDVIPEIGLVCNTKEEFIREINNLNCNSVDKDVLNVFNKYFSTEAQAKRFKSFLRNNKII